MNIPEVSRPNFRSDFRTIISWFEKQPTYKPGLQQRWIPDNCGRPDAGKVYANIFSIPAFRGDNRKPLLEGQQVLSVALQKSPSTDYSIFSMEIVIDEKGKPIRLLDSSFHAWAEVQGREFLLTYEEKKSGKKGVAELTNIQERKGGPKKESAEIDDVEKLKLIEHLKSLGYLSFVDYVRTAKAAMLAKSAESLEIPLRKPKTKYIPPYEYTDSIRQFIPGFGELSAMETRLIAKLKENEIKKLTHSLSAVGGRAGF